MGIGLHYSEIAIKFRKTITNQLELNIFLYLVIPLNFPIWILDYYVICFGSYPFYSTGSKINCFMQAPSGD